MKKLILSFVVVLIFTLGFASCQSSGSNTTIGSGSADRATTAPGNSDVRAIKHVLEDFYKKLLEEGDVLGAINYIDYSSKENHADLYRKVDFNSLINSLKNPDFLVFKINDIDLIVSGNVAKARVYLTLDFDEEEIAEYNMVKVNGDWKIKVR